MVTNEEAELRASIEAAFVSMCQGLSALGAEPARQHFLQTKWDQVKRYEKHLACSIGWEQAMIVTCLAYIQVMEGEELR